jgi:hypothetical protein
MTGAYLLVDGYESRFYDGESDGALFVHGYAFAETTGRSGTRNIFQRDGTAFAGYRFSNFNGDTIHIEFSVPVKQLRKYLEGYGYTRAELDALRDWQKNKLDDTYQHALEKSLSQTDLNKMSDNIKDEYRRKVHDLMVNRGFKYKRTNVLIPDIPGIVKKNVNNLGSVARDIGGIAREKNYRALEVIGASLSFMQTGLEYERIPLKKQDRTIGGIYPPVVTIADGRGDCDSKTALMASILLNWDKAKLIGVGIPNHYLIGILRTPSKGDAFVEYRGQKYVLMEPSGPGRLPPGMISNYTLEILKAQNQVSMEPLERY